jgi:SPP1 gp7 family putative phage head morphogenesis protein
MQRLIRRVIGQLQDQIVDSLFPMLERLAEQNAATRPDRQDAPTDDALDVIETLEGRFLSSIGGREALSAEVEQVAGAVRQFSKRQFNRQLSAVAGFEAQLDPSAIGEVLQGFVSENVRRIRNLGAEQLTKVESAVFNGFRRGRRFEDIAREIRKSFGITKNRANLIARDQVSKLNGELTQIRQTGLGISEYIWRTVDDERVRDEHELLDGERFSWANPPAEGHPGEPINCRCIAEPAIPEALTG